MSRHMYCRKRLFSEVEVAWKMLGKGFARTRCAILAVRICAFYQVDARCVMLHIRWILQIPAIICAFLRDLTRLYKGDMHTMRY